MITASHLIKKYGPVTAVDDVSFTVPEGENLVLLGTSGCGKTTTLRMINRLTEPSSGSITINGTNVESLPAHILRRSIGYVMQQNGLFPHYTVAENIGIVPGLLKWEKEQTAERVKVLLTKLNLSYDEHAHMYPHQLSGGQQQRVALARALATDPPLLLMDEPFGALDPINRRKIRKELSGLDEFKRKTIIMVTHDIHEAFELADRVCLMDKGKIVQLGTPQELQDNPVNEFASAFVKGHLEPDFK